MYIQQEKDGSILLTAPVMIPGVADCDYERGEPPLTRQQIQDFQKSYNKYKFIDHEHELTHNGITRGTPYKSYLLNKDTSFELYDGTSTIYPKGTWMLTSHITDPMAVQTALNGGYTGYSATVRSRTAADKYYMLFKKILWFEIGVGEFYREVKKRLVGFDYICFWRNQRSICFTKSYKS